MIQTISLMVKRTDAAERGRLSRSILAWFVVGGFTGGAIAGALVAGVARLLYVWFGDGLATSAVIAAAVAVLYVGPALRWWRMPMPQLTQQVPSTWREVFPPRLASFTYALPLGFAFLTRVASLAVYPMLVFGLGLGRWPIAVIVMFAIAGLVRAASALLVPFAGWSNVSGTTIFAALDNRTRLADRLEGVALLAAAVGLLTIAVTT